jgi:hypothetical protein
MGGSGEGINGGWNLVKNKNYTYIWNYKKTQIALTMKTINISVSDLEFNKFGLKSNLSFSDFLDIVSRELSKQRLNESLKLAEKFGLSELTMADITKEVKAVRKNAKNRS